MTAPARCLLAVDGLNLIRRVYEAIPTPDSIEKAEAALRSSTASLKRALREHQPSHLFVALDAGGTTWRHALYAGYRAGRSPMPQELADMLPRLQQEWLEAGICVRRIPGVEADDVLATVTKRAQAHGVPTIVLSTDKDLHSLVDELVRARDHFLRKWWDAPQVQEKFGVAPAQLLDWLALVGDPVDGVPGVEGVGAKTAAKLLTEHGTLEAVLAAAPSLRGKLGERLSQYAGLARLSRELTGLKTDVELDVPTWSTLRCPDLVEV